MREKVQYFTDNEEKMLELIDLLSSFNKLIIASLIFSTGSSFSK